MSTKILKGLALAGLVSAAAACSTKSDVEITFYGYPDNDPPSADIAYDCGRGYTAGGTGTHSDPLTFASAPGEFTKCEIIYLPYLRKYLRFEDTCAQCTSDYENGKRHIDIWTGSTTSNGGDAQIDCEDDLTPDDSQTIIIDPSSSLTVNTGKLFSDGSCHTSNTYTDADASSYCSSGSSSSGSGSSSSCEWEGHCAGASCSNENDCSGDLTCKSGKCA
ncbi:hypothetical protein BO94DRAFT_612331 [Aspergillus sclerotioniger CBS 115572]|uniref:Chitin-binding type-4 domain-containing protein n=1 Tax=Aspergillus sclerotioniger CBS 115572 TaxID=1450535 RepID=A0A317V0D0_9EURO|nr:hypothetical protein BO94DRAFT_612331 [Aspergillus sclerotioniger CBS 115572]PWY67119.1 hypothetical protein BO94DRAFT_612331 [Aspergillus sclerotioniger CBS 115572]